MLRLLILGLLLAWPSGRSAAAQTESVKDAINVIFMFCVAPLMVDTGISRPSVLAVLRLMISSSPVGHHTAAFRWLALASRVGHEFVTSRDAEFTGAGHRVV